MDKIVVNYKHVDERFVIHITDLVKNGVDIIVFPKEIEMNKIIEYFIHFLNNEYMVTAFHDFTLPITFSRISSDVKSQFKNLTIELKRKIFDFLDNHSKSIVSCVNKQIYYDTMDIVYKNWEIVKDYPKYKLNCFKSFICYENDFSDYAEHMIITSKNRNVMIINPIHSRLPQNLISLRINVQLQILKQDILPQSIRSLYIQSGDIEPGSLPMSLYELGFGSAPCFKLSSLRNRYPKTLYPNLPDSIFPTSLKKLRIGELNYGVIQPGSIPEGLESFEIYNSERNFHDIIGVGSIPSTVKHLKFCCYFSEDIAEGILPDGLETLVIDKKEVTFSEWDDD
jgi:hypothetical protein